MRSLIQKVCVAFLAGLACLIGTGSVDAQSTESGKYQLKGVWAGVASLDDAKIQEKVDNLFSPQEKEALLKKARLFLTAVVAYEFKDNGEYEADFEINTEKGSVERVSTIGKYQILERNGPKLIVEFLEKSEESQAKPEKKLLQFYEDGENLAMLVPAPPELSDCNPMVIFERVRPDQIMDAESIAKEQGKSSIK